MKKRKHQCGEMCPTHGTRGWGWNGTTEAMLDDQWALIKSALLREDWDEAQELFSSVVRAAGRRT